MENLMAYEYKQEKKIKNYLPLIQACYETNFSKHKNYKKISTTFHSIYPEFNT